MNDEQIEQEVEAGLRCVRCRQPFVDGDEKVCGGAPHPITGLPQTRAVHGPAGDPSCEHHPVTPAV